MAEGVMGRKRQGVGNGEDEVASGRNVGATIAAGQNRRVDSLLLSC